MKKKVISLFVTGMLAVSMIAGCGSDNIPVTNKLITFFYS